MAKGQFIVYVVFDPGTVPRKDGVALPECALTVAELGLALPPTYRYVKVKVSGETTFQHLLHVVSNALSVGPWDIPFLELTLRYWVDADHEGIWHRPERTPMESDPVLSVLRAESLPVWVRRYLLLRETRVSKGMVRDSNDTPAETDKRDLIISSLPTEEATALPPSPTSAASSSASHGFITDPEPLPLGESTPPIDEAIFQTVIDNCYDFYVLEKEMRKIGREQSGPADRLVMLASDRLWFTGRIKGSSSSSAGAGREPLFYIDLGEVEVPKNGMKNSFQTKSHAEEGYYARFFTQHSADAARLVQVLKNPYDFLVPADHMEAADVMIADQSVRQSYAAMKQIVAHTTFEAMLMHHGLRRYFQDFLEVRHTDEYLLCWTYTERYYRRFGEMPGVERATGADAVKDMVEESRFIFQCFIREDALFELSLPSKDRRQIESSFIDEPSPELFLEIERMCWRHLKDQFYYQFIREPYYRRILARMQYAPPVSRGLDPNSPEALTPKRLQSAKRANEEEASILWEEDKWWDALKAEPASLYWVRRETCDPKVIKHPPFTPTSEERLRDVLGDLAREPLNCPFPIPTERAALATAGQGTGSDAGGFGLQGLGLLSSSIRESGPPSPKAGQSPSPVVHGAGESPSPAPSFRITRRASNLLDIGHLWPMGGEMLCHGWMLFQLVPKQANVLDDRAWTRGFATVVNYGAKDVVVNILGPDLVTCRSFDARRIIRVDTRPTPLHSLEIRLMDRHGDERCLLLWPEMSPDDDTPHVTFRRWVAAFALTLTDRKRHEVLHEGYLFKRGIINTGFKKRWFILTGAPRLFYYEKDAFKGEIEMNSILDVKVVDAQSFNLETKDRKWQLQAESKEEMSIWVNALREAMKLGGRPARTLGSGMSMRDIGSRLSIAATGGRAWRR